ncbi:MAG: transporter related protein [Nitrospira sp.]|jgi:lipopolysaccharide transport system ATP-binding protein|nr:transporter related protein [Nitrospira sp.]
MNNWAIQVHNLSKQYRIGKVLNGYSTLREALTERLARPVRWAGQLLQPQRQNHDASEESIWALKNVSFNVRPGEVVGIIGRNGAGKSTLLKILSQITEPSEGFADIYGRVASLLEVGTGFHPELTGRENAYLNGAILGMSMPEIERKFSEIVAFAGVEKFIDTPVKHYSSGMCVRLAFAVAAHLEPEILIIDEVLAVGDAAFQKKCLGKMEGVAKEGRTVLFVSHNMLAVQNLCHRVIWLNDGQVVEDGKSEEVVTNYLRTASSSLTEQVWDDVTHAPGNHKVRLHKVLVRGSDNDRPQHITTDNSCAIEVTYLNQIQDAVLHVTLHVYTEQGVLAFSTGSAQATTLEDGTLDAGLYRSVCHIPGNLLNSGVHRIMLLIVENRTHVIFRQEDVLSFEVLEMGRRQLGWQGREPGAVRPYLKWMTDRVDVGETVKQT